MSGKYIQTAMHIESQLSALIFGSSFKNNELCATFAGHAHTHTHTQREIYIEWGTGSMRLAKMTSIQKFSYSVYQKQKIAFWPAHGEQRESRRGERASIGFLYIF